jgi:tetratricopeptide (TPR) repeat protein
MYNRIEGDFMLIKIVGLLMILLSFCYAQGSAEGWFILARDYEMIGYDNQAVEAYEKASSLDSESVFIKNLLFVRYLRADNFKKANSVSIEDKTKLIAFNEYKDGDKLAQFYCFVGDTDQAYVLWKKLIYNAVETRQLDSALVLANSFAKNMPQSQIPRVMQTYLLKKSKKN